MIWVCPHGRTYAGTEDFISGAKSAHYTGCSHATGSRSRSAITGRFVKLATAIRHPRETIRERRKA